MRDIPIVTPKSIHKEQVNSTLKAFKSVWWAPGHKGDFNLNCGPYKLF